MKGHAAPQLVLALGVDGLGLGLVQVVVVDLGLGLVQVVLLVACGW